MSGPLGDLSKAAMIPRLPDWHDSMNKGETIPPDIVGATITGFGAAPAEYGIEGGGLMIDYVPKGAVDAKRLVLAFNDSGMWITFQG